MSMKRTPEEKLEIVRTCIRIEKQGVDVLAYLRQMDYVTPSATWVNIQKRYMRRTNAALTDGKYTGRARKGKLPQVDPAAIEADRADYERTHGEEPEQRAETVTVGGKEYERMAKPSPACCQPARPSGVTVPERLPEEKTAREGGSVTVPAERITAAVGSEGDAVHAVKAPPKLRCLSLGGMVGTWSLLDPESKVLYFVRKHEREEIAVAAHFTVQEWLALAAELPEVIRELGL